MAVPSKCRIVIIGGGAIGCGVAYSLASAGKSDILLVEREGDVGQVTTAQGDLRRPCRRHGNQSRVSHGRTDRPLCRR